MDQGAVYDYDLTLQKSSHLVEAESPKRETKFVWFADEALSQNKMERFRQLQHINAGTIDGITPIQLDPSNAEHSSKRNSRELHKGILMIWCLKRNEASLVCIQKCEIWWFLSHDQLLLEFGEVSMEDFVICNILTRMCNRIAEWNWCRKRSEWTPVTKDRRSKWCPDQCARMSRNFSVSSRVLMKIWAESRSMRACHENASTNLGVLSHL